jgi:hypothetical protein
MASVAPVYEERSMSIGRVFQRAFSTVAHNPVVVLGLALVLGALPSVLISLVTRPVTAAAVANGRSMSVIWGAMFVSWIVSVLISAIVQGALTRATVAENEGGRAGFAECIAAALRVLLPLIGVGLIFGFAIAIGFVLLVIPGIFVMIIWSVAAPAVVVERDGAIMALSRSTDLTKGSRWRIFGLFLILLVIYLLLFALLGVVGLKAMTADPAAGFSLFNLVASTISAWVFNLVWGTIQPALYIELRQAKEGDSVDHLEQVFA